MPALRRYIFSLAVTGGARFAIAALSVLFSFYVARQYDLATLGAFTLATSIVVGLSLLSRLGFERSILKLSGSLERRDGAFYTTLKNTLTITFGLGLLVLLVAFPVNLWLADANEGVSRYLRLLLLLIPFWSVNFVVAQYLNGIGRPYLAPLYEPSGSVSLLLIAVALVNAGRETPIPFDMVVRIYIALPITAAVAAWAGIHLASRSMERTRSTLTATFLRYREENFDFFVTSVTAYVFTLGLFPMVGLFLDNAGVGYFRLCERLASTVSFILIIINAVMGPRYALAWRKGAYRQLEHLFRTSIVLGFCLAVPLVIALLVYAAPLITLVARADADAGSPVVLRILVIATLLHVLTGGSQQLLNMTGHHAIARNVSVLMLPVGVAIFAALTARFGVAGAATAFLIFMICSNGLRMIGVRQAVFGRPEPLASP